jgi:uncharacterized membrane protein YgcG
MIRTSRCVRAGVVMLALVLAVVTPATAASAESAVRTDTSDFTFDSFDADYHLDRDADGRATLRTVETIVAEFPATDQNRGIVRAIPNEYRSADLDVSVTGITDETGAAVVYELSESDGFTELALGTDDFVHGRTTYVIEYTQRDVIGAFADTGADEFYWDVNGTGWAQPFGTVTARLHLDDTLADALSGQSACYTGHYGSTDICGVEQTTDATGTVLTATSTDLLPAQNLTLAVGFAPGTFTPPPSAADSWIVTVVPWAILGLAALLVAGLLVLRTFVWRDAAGRGTVIVQYTPPEDVPVLLAAVLLGKKKVGLPAQLIGFAVARAARLVESPSEPASRRYAIEVRDVDRLGTADRRILGALLPQLKNGARLRLDTADRKLGDRIHRLTGSMTDEVTTQGFRARGKSRIPAVLVLTATLLVGVAWLVNSWAGNHDVASDPVAALLPVTILALAVLTACVRLPNRLTEKGALLREHLLGMRDYLRLVETDRIRVLQSPDGAERSRAAGFGEPGDTDLIVTLHEKLLPWAMLWGVENEWADELGSYYETTDAEPDWYSGEGGSPAFSRNFGGYRRAVAAGSFARTPPKSSGSGSSWSGSGGSSRSGGSSGGGFSGGGGGGGGGRGR